MMRSIKFVHTNIISKDWKKLAQFYIDVFGCEPLYPERNHSGQWIEQLTDIEDVHIRGIQLRLPGYTGDAPALEIFQYNKQIQEDKLPDINKVGLAHTAFLVDDINFYINKLLENGGSKLGELVETEVKGAGILTVVYLRDTEGNIIELQNWR